MLMTQLLRQHSMLAVASLSLLFWRITPSEHVRGSGRSLLMRSLAVDIKHLLKEADEEALRASCVVLDLSKASGFRAKSKIRRNISKRLAKCEANGETGDATKSKVHRLLRAAKLRKTIIATLEKYQSYKNTLPNGKRFIMEAVREISSQARSPTSRGPSRPSPKKNVIKTLHKVCKPVFDSDDKTIPPKDLIDVIEWRIEGTNFASLDEMNKRLNVLVNQVMRQKNRSNA